MLTVLVLDNQPAAAFKMLASADMLIVPATTAEQAWHALEQYRPTLFVCDLGVANVSANAVLDLVRAKSPDSRLLLTGPSLCRVQALNLADQGSIAGFVPKPWQSAAIRAAVHSALPEYDFKTPAKDARKPQAVKPFIPAPSNEEPRYRLDEKIGEGGTGQVYRAHDLLLDMPVAVKVLHPALSRNSQALVALQSEARISMQLTHPHIVRLYNLSKRGDVYLLVMEFIRGDSLHMTLKNPMSRDTSYVVALSQAIASALDYAHRHGVLHSDLTPSNVLISEDGVPKLIDFGIASLINRQAERGAFVVGTPAYMSPEQLRGDAQDARSDVFSFAVIVYQMLTGYLPQTADATPEDLAYRPRPGVVGVTPAAAAVLNKGLALEAAGRWSSAGEFYCALAAAFGVLPI
jgi:serine/threonine-protein kinase